MQVLLQWVGFNDMGTCKVNPDGPSLQLLNAEEYRDRFDRVYLFANEESRPIAQALAKYLGDGGRKRPEATVVLLDAPDPTDYGVLYREMTGACRQIQDDLADEDPKFAIHISPGTPQAQTVWLLMAKGGDVKADVLQTIRQIYRGKDGEVARRVDLAIDDFPVIRRLERENRELRTALGKKVSFGALQTRSPAMRRTVRQLEQAACHPQVHVLLTGETGVGKDFCAKVIHHNSDRRDKPYIPVHCAGMSESLIESELFGHVKGAFTGAHANRPGRFEEASEGTIFLDEIGDMPIPMQARLLRVLNDGTYQRIGENKERTSHARVIAATNADLKAKVETGEFRQDLYHRLNVLHIDIPPLRERPEDIELLCEDLWQSVGNDEEPPEFDLPPEAANILRRYEWPGNVRELRKVLELLYIESEHDAPTAETARVVIDRARREAPRRPVDAEPRSNHLEDVEREHVLRVWEKHGCVIRKAAAELGIDRNTLSKKLKKWGLKDGAN